MKKINEKLKVIKIQLDAVRRKLNRVQTALKVNAEVPNSYLENRHFLQLQLKTIEDALVEYNANQQRIYSLDVGDEAREEADVMYVRFEQRYGELYVFIIKLLDDIVKKENVPVVAAAPVPVASAAAMHLPPLKVPLPTFDGTYENWYAFKSMFETIMNRYQSESPAIKLYHLLNSLVGKAAGIIDQEIINNNDYAAAWSTLTERFENKRLIIDKHIDALFDLPRMTSENATELRKLIDVCSRNVDALKNLELPVEGLGESILINRITKKLDDETREAWELDQSANEMPDYDSTMEFLKERCRVLEKIRVPEKRIVKPVKLLKPTVEVRTKGSSLVATADKCPQCSNNHALWKCDFFKKANLTDRYNTLRRIGACFNCLQKGHRTVECSSEHSCKKCNKRHHTFLHPNETSTKKSEAPSAVNSKDDQQNQKREVPAGPSTSTPAISKEEQQSNFCTRPKSGRQILLSTAVVLVYGKANNPYPCRVLLDSGSHTNFVSEHFATLLGLKKQPANFSIGGLNETQTKVRFNIHTQLKSRVTDYTACLELLVVPKITGELKKILESL
ncbi:uncharacterized protein LOC135709560 [Ochlerotatus camptorhynchus]|uniref:uncharacterized protein LOC135709560 n=1 Tax=Ochlerotatus camptorhynchus TaxID=644619 RepID=UPI0031CF7C6B